MEWLDMGGHGIYVWSAYGLGLGALVGVALWPLLALKRLRRAAMTRTGEDGSAP